MRESQIPAWKRVKNIRSQEDNFWPLGDRQIVLLQEAFLCDRQKTCQKNVTYYYSGKWKGANW